MVNALRSLRATIGVADPIAVVNGVTELELVTCNQLSMWVVGRVVELAVEDGKLVGTLEFSDTRYGKSSRELCETNELEPRLSVGTLGVMLQLI